MMDEQNFSVVNDKNRDGEINFFVDVRHDFSLPWTSRLRKRNQRRFER